MTASMGLLNIQGGVVEKRHQIGRRMEAEGLDLLVLAEIKIGAGEEEKFCKGWPSGISVAAVKAGPNGGGGVAILVRDGVLNWEADDEKLKPVGDVPGADVVSIQVATDDDSIRVVGIYCPLGPAGRGWTTENLGEAAIIRKPW